MEENNQTDKPQIIEGQQGGNELVVKSPANPFRTVRKISAWAMIICAILFAIIAILAIWGVFNSSSDFIWRSLSTLTVLAFCSLVINVGSKIYDSVKNK